MDTDVRSVLSAIRVPTLVTHQVGDRLINPDCSLDLAERIEGAVVGELPGENLPPFADQGPFVEMVSEFLPSHSLPATPDRSLATIVFTDIVGSTARAAALGDQRWRSVLDAHDDVVRAQLRRFGGKEIKTTGDGFLASFDGPARAVRFGAATVDALARLEIDVRVGVHTGECEVRGNDLGGLAVHIAARVGALAGAGEILVSSTVKDLVVGSGLTFDDHGDHDLKGVPGSWHLWSLAAP